MRQIAMIPLVLFGTAAVYFFVLIPAQDKEQNIARCLDSLLEQSYANYEILSLPGREASNLLAGQNSAIATRFAAGLT